MVWLQIFATVVVCGAIIADVAKNNHQNNKYKTDCNSCVFLVRKDRWRLGEYKYRCREHGGFDKPPIFCADYRKRSTDEWETLDKGSTSAADVRPVVRGKWIDGVCSNCGFFTDVVMSRFFSYCPNCGADMREQQKEE